MYITGVDSREDLVWFHGSSRNREITGKSVYSRGLPICDAIYSDLQPGKPLLAQATMTLSDFGCVCAWAHSTRMGLLYKKFALHYDCRCVNTKAQRAWLRVSSRALRDPYTADFSGREDDVGGYATTKNRVVRVAQI